MLKLHLHRHFRGPAYTIGRLSVDGTYFCDTLEDTVRPLPATCPDTPRGRDCHCTGKVWGATAIPPGTYRVVMGHSPRFGRQMMRVEGVPHFRGILIHAGNTARDTAGCILVGRNTVKGRVTSSRDTEARLRRLVCEEEARGGAVSLTVG